MIAGNWLLSREALEAYALESHQRALRGHRQGPLHSRPLAGSSTTKHRPTTLAKMAERDVLFGCDRMAAAVSSKTCDASAMLIVSEAALKRQSKAIEDPGKRAFLADELPDCRAARFDLQWLR
ncbi:hypothetical protein [Stutzerimonas stutzeri]|nr:hypothetical protein [Stutzerimonas stutzeri]QUE75089.1 hypothetical protein KCX70_17870 [Stutzerimonas stutzeri]